MALAAARLRWLSELGLGAATMAFACATCCAQMPIGSVSILDATVNGATSIANDRAQLGNNGTVTAKDHVAFVQLVRGGSVKVCATSGVHLTAGAPATAADATVPASPAPASSGAQPDSASAAGTPPVTPPPAWAPNIPPPLMVALDRGAMELRMGAVPGDIVMTPDLRFSFSGDGQLDVHIRVTRNGDTCVENRVAGLSGHPELRVGSLFGTETYNILPGQHVLFEGGSLREVVDNESSPCGCPETAAKPPAPPPLGDIALLSAPKTAVQPVAVQHPFPADVSQGLAPPPPVPQAPPNVVHTQVAATLVYNPTATDAQTQKSTSAKPSGSDKKSGFFHSLGHFFKQVF